MKIFNQIVIADGADFRLSKLFWPDGTTCFVLEDCERPYGIKIQDETALPLGTYYLELSQSQRYGKLMPKLFTNLAGTVVAGGIKFTGVRIHGGNDVEDTSGCPLVAEHYSLGGGKCKVWGSRSGQLIDMLTGYLAQGHSCLWIISRGTTRMLESAH